jgi:hypothetical protein
MLKRGRSATGIELLPAELDFAAAAEIGPPVDLTCVFVCVSRSQLRQR